MTRTVLSVDEDASLEHIATLLEEHGIKHVPVLRSGLLVGIVSRADLPRGIAARQDEPSPATGDEGRHAYGSRAQGRKGRRLASARRAPGRKPPGCLLVHDAGLAVGQIGSSTDAGPERLRRRAAQKAATTTRARERAATDATPAGRVRAWSRAPGPQTITPLAKESYT